jgi:hypothetical protein
MNAQNDCLSSRKIDPADESTPAVAQHTPGKGDFDEIWTLVANWRAYPGIARDLSDFSLKHNTAAV